MLVMVVILVVVSGGSLNERRSKIEVACCEWAENELEMRASLLGTACYMGWWLEQCKLPLLNKRLVSLEE